MHIEFCTNYVKSHFGKLYFKTNFGELFRSWDKGQRTLGHQLQTGLPYIYMHSDTTQLEYTQVVTIIYLAYEI